MRSSRFLLALAGALLISASALAAAQRTPPSAVPAQRPPPSPALLAGPEPWPKIVFQTSMGDIRVRLDHVAAPVTVDNFLRYIREGHFDNTLFYRVVRGFVIQGGSIGADGLGRPTHESIPLEANNGLKNFRGAISMARAEPTSATAEFFIVLEDNTALDHRDEDPGNTTGYAVFGYVVDGLDVVDKIAAVPVGAPVGPFPDSAPKESVIIRKVLISNP